MVVMEWVSVRMEVGEGWREWGARELWAVDCGLWAEGGGCCSMLLRLLESYYCTEYLLLSCECVTLFWLLLCPPRALLLPPARSPARSKARART